MTDERKEFTRHQYLEKECTHQEYYGQFVNETILEAVGYHKERFMKSIDPNLNDISLSFWDSFQLMFRCLTSVHEKMKKQGDYLTQCGIVCIVKESARQIIEQERNQNGSKD